MHHLIKKAIAFGAFLLVSSAICTGADEAKPSSRIPTPEARVVLRTISDEINAKNYANAEALAKQLIGKSAQGSADYAYANFLMASVYSAQNKFHDSISYLEKALACDMFEPAETEHYTYALAQLYVETKQIPKAIALIKSYMTVNPNIPPDSRYMYAIILKESGDSKEAGIQTEKLMLTTLTPSKEYYQLAASCAQDLGNYEKACAYLERLLQMDPQNDIYWTQLVAMHYNAGELLAAIVAIDRAQEAGLLLAETNYVLRIELYYSMERFREAAVEIEKALKNGKISNEQRFWEMLSSCYDNIGESQKAIDVLKTASQTTNWSIMDVRLGEYYYRSGDYANALTSFENAIKKGHSEKLGDIWILTASAALETKNFDKADVALANAEKYPEVKTKADKLKKNLIEMKNNEEAEKAEKAEKASR